MKEHKIRVASLIKLEEKTMNEKTSGNKSVDLKLKLSKATLKRMNTVLEKIDVKLEVVIEKKVDLKKELRLTDEHMNLLKNEFGMV